MMIISCEGINLLTYQGMHNISQNQTRYRHDPLDC